MKTRKDILSEACTNCLKELYSLAQPSIEWEDFKKENKIYSEIYQEWEDFNHAYNLRNKNPEKWDEEKSKHPSWENKSITECIGPKPYEFYYLPKEIMEEICNSYVNIYNIDHQQNLLDTIDILKNYCKNPIVDKYIKSKTDENGNYHPGYRSYDNPDNIIKEFINIIPDTVENKNDIADKLWNKVEDFLDMAGKFYNWNTDLNAFNMTIYLGPSPNSNKDVVVDNWKIYRNKTIEIDESKYEEEYYD